MIKSSEVKIDSGTCPGGTITVGRGNAGMMCNLHIRAGYHEFYEASIDLTPRTASELIAHLNSLIEISKIEDIAQEKQKKEHEEMQKEMEKPS